MPKLRFKGKTTDFYRCVDFTASPGAVVEVRPAKANQLLEDFPEDWEEIGDNVVATISEPPPISEEKKPDAVKGYGALAGRDVSQSRPAKPEPIAPDTAESEPTKTESVSKPKVTEPPKASTTRKLRPSSTGKSKRKYTRRK